jgi:SAM-dependent methyltransferase
MNEVRQQWEARARMSTCLSGVLFQGLSQDANAALDAWHAWIVRTVFLPQLRQSARILDLGCGYGRLSKIVADERPDIQIIGQDLALDYCRIFAGNCGPCALADASMPPFLAGSFDGIMAITCLMYIPRPAVTQALRHLQALLRADGAILAVDPGYELQRLIARVRGGKSTSPTGGLGFKREEYAHGFEESGFSLVAKGGNPRLSRALMIPGVAPSRRAWVAALLARRAQGDCAPGGYTRFALHRWLLARKRESR